MVSRFRREAGIVVAWIAFPLVPVVLADLYHQVWQFLGREPRVWDWFTWIIMLGPLAGFGFLVGATADLHDDVEPGRRIWRRVVARRSVWVAIGPWWGFLIWLGLFTAYSTFESSVPGLLQIRMPGFLRGTSAEPVIFWTVGTLFVIVIAYSWLWPASAALRRAAQSGGGRRAFYRGTSVALAFVGSLIGGFWAATAWWRAYFFDPRVVPLVIMAVGLISTSGCGASDTYGDVRRRELYHAMLVAWVLGLAVMWRWWGRSRPRTRPPLDVTNQDENALG